MLQQEVFRIRSLSGGACPADPTQPQIHSFSSPATAATADASVSTSHVDAVECTTPLRPAPPETAGDSGSMSASQRRVMAERASASFRQDRRLQRGCIGDAPAPFPTASGATQSSCSSSHSAPPAPQTVKSPGWAALPASVMGRGAWPPGMPPMKLDAEGGGEVVALGKRSHASPWTTNRCCAARAPMPALQPPPPFSPPGGAAQQALTAEDDEGDVEYKWRLTGISATRFQHLVTQMQFRVSEGRGQCLYELGVSDDGTPRGLTLQDFNESVDTIRRMAAQLQLEATLLQRCVVARRGASSSTSTSTTASPYDKMKGTPAGWVEGSGKGMGERGAAGSAEEAEDTGELLCGEIMVSRRQAGNGSHDLSLAFCGAVGSGKSTLMAVLLTSRLDDGCGGTRQSLFNHKHELDSGRTSSLASRVWTVPPEAPGASPVATLPLGAAAAAGAGAGAGGEASPVAFSWPSAGPSASPPPPPTPPFTCASPRSITLLDAGGDVTKTMLFGLMSRKPDYVCVCVAADTADVADVPLYAEVCCAMNTPFLVAVTKSDRVEEFELDGLLMELAVALQAVGCASEQVDSLLLADECCREWLPRHRDAAVEGGVGRTTPAMSPITAAGPVPPRGQRLRVPVFCVSSVEGGAGLELFRSCISHLQNPPPSPPQSPASWATKPPFEVLLDYAFAVDGVGPVVHGRVSHGPVEVGCTCYVGPGSDGRFYMVLVRGIHVDGEHVNEAQVGDEATFALDRLPEAVTVSHKGKVLVRQPERVARGFQATVVVLSQSMSERMEPIMYTRNARQAVSVTSFCPLTSAAAGGVAGQRDTVLLQCRFLFRPEVVSAGDAVVLHWAPRGIAVGRILSVEASDKV